MTRVAVGTLDVHPLCLGSNIFGWTVDEAEAFAVLDAYAAGGGNFIDTADVYSAWVEGLSGGDAETIIGRWLAARGNRDDIVVATKVGAMGPLTVGNIRSSLEESLTRLQTDYVDLYYAHVDDADTPLEETLTAFDVLIREGKVRQVAASNYTASRLVEALAVSDREGLARYVALSPFYNLIERAEFEGELRDACEREGVVTLPYYGLAKGFLTGKHRSGSGADTKRREQEPSGAAERYLDDPRAVAVLDALVEVAAEQAVPPAAVALAWLTAQPTVACAIASARTPDQVADLLPMADLSLSADQLERLAAAA